MRLYYFGILVVNLLVIVLLLPACNQCVEDCGENAICRKKSCECVHNDMLLVRSGTTPGNSFRCFEPYLFESAYAYMPTCDDCLCTKDIVLLFYGCQSSSGGIVGNCRAEILYKPQGKDYFHEDIIDVDAYFPSNPEATDLEVYVSFGGGIGSANKFCQSEELPYQVDFVGYASQDPDRDTLFLKRMYGYQGDTVFRDTCEVKFVRVKKTQ